MTTYLTRIEIAKTYPVGGVRFLGFGPNHSFYVTVDEVVFGQAIHVDQTVRRYTDDGRLLGVARVPLAQRFTQMDQSLTVGPDGAVYTMLTRPDHVEIQRLSFVPSLHPILTP